MKILTLYNAKELEILISKSQQFGYIASGLLTKSELEEAEEIANKLIETLKPLMPAAGLAAPQIGILRRIFIYSWDRTLEHLEVVINPQISFVENNGEVTAWEACFSAMKEEGEVQAALVTRYNAINVTYINLEGERINKTLTGFAAKVFQHEYDHLEGIIDTDNKKAKEIKTFINKKEFIEFMESVKRDDSKIYVDPNITHHRKNNSPKI